MRNFAFELPGRGPVFVKQAFDAHLEGVTQHFLYLLSQKDESAPRIPRVIDRFSHSAYSIIVMEKVDAPPLSKCDISDDEAVEHAAFAVGWLLKQLPSVPEDTFGRPTSDPKALALHRFFKDHEAPYVFANERMLAEYVLRASKRVRWGGEVFPNDVEEILALFGDPRCIYHSDISKDNFLLDADGTVWIVDFQDIGVLPEIFQTLHSSLLAPLLRGWAGNLAMSPRRVPKQ
ncbi:hypothetical protein NMY22_g7854 [Coprinellus aureogranulatus]|nr:hypothetical protein NMY22_g7854 [Coprinellus aureogranulatus]